MQLKIIQSPSSILIIVKFFGPNIGCLKDKTTQQKAETIQNYFIEIPRELILRHEEVTLFMDILYINRMSFLTTISEHIHYCTIKLVKKTTANNYRNVLDKVFWINNSAGFYIKKIWCNNEFKPLMELLKDNLEIKRELHTTTTTLQTSQTE